MTLEQFLPLFAEGLHHDLIAIESGSRLFGCGYDGSSCRGCPLEHTEVRWCSFDASFNSSPEVLNYVQLNHPEILI